MYSFNFQLVLILISLNLTTCKENEFIIARLITIDDSYKFTYKTRFKFTNVLTTNKTLQFVKSNSKFSSMDTIVNVPVVNLGRLQKNYHTYDNIGVYSVLHLFQAAQFNSQLQLMMQSQQSFPQIFILNLSNKHLIFTRSPQNVCWVNDQNLIKTSYESTHSIIQKCIQQLNITHKIQSHSFHQHSQTLTQTSILEYSIFVCLGWLIIFSFTGIKLYLIGYNSKSQSVV